MGFSKDNFEQYRREIRIMWRVLAVGAVIAGGAHLFSLPWISKLVSSSAGDSSPEIAAIPIEIVVEEDVVQQTPDPEPEPPEENPEPAASASRPSAAPLATNAEPVPTREVASADTVAVAPSIATASREVDGQGAVGESSAVGLVTGSGEPTESGDRINLPSITPPSVQTPRTPVQETSLAARPSPAASYVSCNPCSSPEYANSARRTGREGKPVLEVTYGADGRVTEATIVSSSGNRELDEAARAEAIANWNLDDSRGTGGRVRGDVVYVLNDSEQYEEAQEVGETLTVPANRQAQGSPPPASSAPTTGPSIDTTGSGEPTTMPPSPPPAAENNPPPVGAVSPTPTPASSTPPAPVSIDSAPVNPAPAVPDIFPVPPSPPSSVPPPIEEAPPPLSPTPTPPPATTLPAPASPPDIMPQSIPE